jgi:hypothetical protein
LWDVDKSDPNRSKAITIDQLLSSAAGDGLTTSGSALTVNSSVARTNLADEEFNGSITSNKGGTNTRWTSGEALGTFAMEWQTLDGGSSQATRLAITGGTNNANIQLLNGASGSESTEAVFQGGGKQTGLSGVTSPSYALEVGGTIATDTEVLLTSDSAAVQGQNSKFNLGFSHGTWRAGSSGVDFRFLDTNKNDILRVVEGGKVAIAQSSASYDLDVSGTVNASDLRYTSDERLKTNLSQISDPLRRIGELTGYTFEWDEEAEVVGPAAGHSAQEVEDVLPEVVDNTQEYKSLKGNLTALHTEAIKALAQEVRELREVVYG